MSETEKQNDTEEQKITSAPDGADEADRTDSELHSIIYGGEYSEYQEELGAEEEEPAPKRVLRTFEAKAAPEAGAAEKKTKTETNKKLTFLIIAAAVTLAAIGLIIYYVNANRKTSDVRLDEGEMLSTSGRVMMFEHIPRERIQAIEVHNQYGDYTVYYNAEEEVFCFLGLENLPYNNELFSQLVVASGFPLISDKFLPDDEDRAPLKDYGLGEDDDKAYYIITTRPADDTPSVSYKVYIGKPSLTENYYYCMVEGRDIVYILEQSIKNTLLADVKSLMTPILTYPIEDNSYLTNIPEINIYKDGSRFIKVVYQDTGANVPGVEQFGVTVPYIVTDPVEYDASTEIMTNLLGQIVNMSGTELVEYNIFDTVLVTDENGDPVLDENGEQEHEYVLKNPEALEKYGVLNPAYEVSYTYTVKDEKDKKIEDIENDVLISPLQRDEDGHEFYYLASLVFNTVVKQDASALSFLTWPLMDYLDKPVFSVQIDKVSRIKISAAGGKNYDFALTGTDDDLVAVESANGRTVFKGDEKTAGENHGIRNFRMLYQTILSINREDFTEEPHEDERALLLELEVTFRNGSVRTYKFYSYSERRCFMTVNDQGEFYVKRSMIKKLVSDADKLLSYQTIDPNADY